MKKILSIILCVSILACVFVACSNSKNEKETTTEQTVTEITTDSAVIKESDAIELIKSYSAKELGISEKDYKLCSFMVANAGAEVNGKYYIKVIATIPTKHDNEDGSESYTFDNKGEYYISYDGKQILQKDLSAEEETYNEMKVKPVPTTKPAETKAE